MSTTSPTRSRSMVNISSTASRSAAAEFMISSKEMPRSGISATHSGLSNSPRRSAAASETGSGTLGSRPSKISAAARSASAIASALSSSCLSSISRLYSGGSSDFTAFDDDPAAAFFFALACFSATVLPLAPCFLEPVPIVSRPLIIDSAAALSCSSSSGLSSLASISPVAAVSRSLRVGISDSASSMPDIRPTASSPPVPAMNVSMRSSSSNSPPATTSSTAADISTLRASAFSLASSITCCFCCSAHSCCCSAFFFLWSCHLFLCLSLTSSTRGW
mmetsp:Transcript_10730/g.30468  ORF Transcript_10730/g.30468 Transcript_10730/m.30468 type:complete len:277 (-) Transcript_10730:4109-4939(-)